MSPDFQLGRPGSSIFLDARRAVSVMANEEDHIRLQAVTPGFSLGFAQGLTLEMEKTLKMTMQFAQDAEHGFLAASPSNCGGGRRLGVMLHLPGIAQAGEELPARPGFEIRGYLGETTGGIGGFVQLSGVGANIAELEAIAKLLIGRERKARAILGPEKLRRQVELCLERIESDDGLTLQEAVNTVSILRLGSVYGTFERTPKDLDALLAILSFGPPDEPLTNSRRTSLMRRFLRTTLPWNPSYTNNEGNRVETESWDSLTRGTSRTYD